MKITKVSERSKPIRFIYHYIYHTYLFAFSYFPNKSTGLGCHCILGGSKITAHGDCSHEIKRRLLLGRKVMTNLLLLNHFSRVRLCATPWTSRNITLPTKVRLVKAMVFPVVMYGCESWTVKKAERRRIDVFELWCWRRLQEIQPVHPKGDQSWVFIGRNDAKAETPVLWPPHAKS